MLGTLDFTGFIAMAAVQFSSEHSQDSISCNVQEQYLT